MNGAGIDDRKSLVSLAYRSKCLSLINICQLHRLEKLLVLMSRLPKDTTLSEKIQQYLVQAISFSVTMLRRHLGQLVQRGSTSKHVNYEYHHQRSRLLKPYLYRYIIPVI